MPCRSSTNLIFWTVAQTAKVTPLAIGEPGCCKPQTVEAFARAISRQCCTLVGSLREPADVGDALLPDTVWKLAACNPPGSTPCAPRGGWGNCLRQQNGQRERTNPVVRK
jgi:hypothetical protein